MLSSILHHGPRTAGRLVTTQSINNANPGSPKSPINRVLIADKHEESPAEEFTRMKDIPVHPHGDRVTFSHQKG